MKQTEESNKKRSATLKGRMPKNIELLHTKAVRFKKGRVPWNKGIPLSKQMDKLTRLERRKKISQALKKLYKDGIRKISGDSKNTSERHRLIGTIEYKLWRLAVFERDKYTCRVCNTKGGILHAHHIKEWAKHSELRFDINNGLTLCRKCHIEVHRKC